MKALSSFIRNRRNRLCSSCLGPTGVLRGIQPESVTKLTQEFCSVKKRKPDGLFTFNKIILEEIVISQRNFLASSAILASKLI